MAFEMVAEARIDRAQRSIGIALEQLGDVGPGGEDPGGRGVDDDDRRRPRVCLELLVQLVDRGLVEGVLLLGPVDPDEHDGAAVVDSEVPGASAPWGRTRPAHARSTKVAMPCPTPMHIVAAARVPAGSARRRWSSVVRIRAPEHPMG